MAITRDAILWAADNRWLREHLPRYRFVRSSVARFMPGEELVDALGAAERLAAQDIDAEVLDLRTLSPLDRDAILRSVAKTHRLVIAHDAVKPFGFGAEIAAMVAEEALEDLDARPKRVTPPYTPVPFSPSLENAYYPQVEAIEAAVKSVLGRA